MSKRSEDPDLSGTTQSKKPKIPSLLLIFSVFILFNSQSFIFSQEGDDPLSAYKWYYCPRAFPFDTIPGGAYENAIAQRDALRQSSGFQFPAPAEWKEIGPKPFHNGSILSSGRIHQVLYDPLDTSGNTFYATGDRGFMEDNRWGFELGK